MTAREQAIVDLLRRYRDLVGVSSSGDALMGRVSPVGSRALYSEGGDWDKSGCDALDDLLRRLKRERPGQWWHLTERYLRCDVRSRRIKTEGGKLPKPGPHREFLGHGVRPPDLLAGGEVLVVVEEWRKEVRLDKVRHAIAYLAERFPWDRYRWEDLAA
jgi:hypothetical protein